MMKMKICLLGAFAVGKTSLIERFIRSIFSEKYQATVGVKVDKKEMQVRGEEVALLIWDLQGEDEIQKINLNYLRGAAGFFLVVDGTRRETLDVALGIAQRAIEVAGQAPFHVLLNKNDLDGQWELTPDDLERFEERGWTVSKTSAKTGQGVEKAFSQLAEKMLPN